MVKAHVEAHSMAKSTFCGQKSFYKLIFNGLWFFFNDRKASRYNKSVQKINFDQTNFFNLRG